MTDTELLSRVLGVLEPGVVELYGLRRDGRLLLGLPEGREAAGRALRLYQPQRLLARGLVAVLRGMVAIGQHRRVLRRLRVGGVATPVMPALCGVERGTCGVMLGSPEHRVRRAIASYRRGGEWEVAKLSFGAAGAQVLGQEARVLEQLHPLTAGVPRLLGLHQAESLTVLRMPYLAGGTIIAGESTDALRLLARWITHQVPQPITGFPEWPAIKVALAGDAAACGALARLSQQMLCPVICHGDFARWNLLRGADGSLVALDWEWGHKDGLPGVDLVHYFLQDERLVKRLGPDRAIARTLEALTMPACRDYLRQTGWSGDAILPVLACLAYKQGAGHQANRDVLQAAVARLSHTG